MHRSITLFLSAATVFLSAATLFLFAATLAFTQTAAKPLAFEVASIKPSDPGAHGSSILTNRAGDLDTENIPLRALIAAAYGVRDFQLTGGPGWVGTERFDIKAKTARMEDAAESPDPRELSDQQRAVRDAQWKEKVLSLLADRFRLVVHKEMKEQQVYWLVIAKGGPKMKLVETQETVRELAEDEAAARASRRRWVCW